MKTVNSLIKRNTKLFFKDKGMFLVSLITPVILLVLYATFLRNVYKGSFMAGLPEWVSEKLVNSLVGGQLISSILSVSAVTVAFCSNMLMVQDKANGSIKDLSVSPVKPSTLAVSYYISNLISTIIICLSAAAICLVYIAFIGFYMSVADMLLLFIDIVLLVLFGSALSSVINFFLSTQAQISAVGTMVSSTYGFISGAYMPISQFSEGLQKVISFLPGSYGTALLRNHATRGAFEAMLSEGIPQETIDALADSIDCNIYFFGNKVPTSVSYLILCSAIVLLIAIYVALNVLKSKKRCKA